jgi:hypothetical protein
MRQPIQLLESWDAGGGGIGFVHQPANSPDCNTLFDLAIFCAIQSLQYQKCPRNIDKLIAHVQESFTEIPLDVCSKVWTTAQIVMHQILLHNGNSNYKLPHVGKLKIEKAVGRNISMRLPCRALIDGGALDCQYITTFLSNGKFIVVLTASRCPHRRLLLPSQSPSSSSVALSTSPSSSTSSAHVALSKAASAIAAAVSVCHRHLCRCPPSCRCHRHHRQRHLRTLRC